MKVQWQVIAFTAISALMKPYLDHLERLLPQPLLHSREQAHGMDKPVPSFAFCSWNF